MQVSAPITAGKSFHFDHRSQRLQSGVSDGSLPSKSSVFELFLRQKTTFRLLQEHHQPVQEARSPLARGVIWLFLQPNGYCVATNTKDAFDPTHTRTLVVCSDNLLFLRFRVAPTWLENTALAASFAPDLLATASIVSILYDIGTAARATDMNDCFCDHN